MAHLSSDAGGNPVVQGSGNTLTSAHSLLPAERLSDSKPLAGEVKVEGLVPTRASYAEKILSVIHDFAVGASRFLSAADVFISYARIDGTNYAAALANQLASGEEQLSCILDQWDTRPGTKVPQAVLCAARNARGLVIVASPASAGSHAMDEEIAAFLQLPGPIVLTTFPESEFSKAVWYNRIAGIAPAIEAGGMEALRQGSPSLELLARIKNAVGYWKRNTRIRIAAGAGITVFLIAAAGAGIASLIASQQVEKAGLAFAAAKQATEKADEEATRADAAREAEKEATERAASASAARDQAVEQAAAATAVADQQRTIARRLSAENLVSAAVLRAPEDPAASVRLAEAATEVDPGQNVRNLLFYALRHSPAWNRFPAFPDESFRGELIPRSDREGLTFATDPQIRVVAFKDVKDPRTLVVNDVDTGRTLRRLKIDLAEEVADIQPYARQVLVLRRQVADKQLIRAYEFDALVSDSTDVQPTFRTVAVAIDCADGGWPCALLNTDRHLLLLTKTGSGLEAVNLGAYPGADRVAIHPTGMAVAMFDRLGGITWIARGERWGSGATRKLSFGAGRWQRYGDRIPPLPWLRWGLCPNISL